MRLKTGLKIKRQKFLERLTDMQYERNDYERLPGMFSVKGEAIEIVSPDGETIIGLEFFGDEIERISERKNSLDSKFLTLDSKEVFPAKHFVTPKDKLNTALVNIEKELSN